MLGESETSGIFCCALGVFSQVAALTAHPFRPPQPGFPFLRKFSLIGVVYLAKIIFTILAAIGRSD